MSFEDLQIRWNCQRRVRHTDHKRRKEEDRQGALAVLFQHEIAELNGILAEHAAAKHEHPSTRFGFGQRAIIIRDPARIDMLAEKGIYPGQPHRAQSEVDPAKACLPIARWRLQAIFASGKAYILVSDRDPRRPLQSVFHHPNHRESPAHAL